MWGKSSGSLSESMIWLHACLGVHYPGHLTARCHLVGHVSSFKFQETFFSPAENKTTNVPPPFPLIGYMRQLQHADWPDWRHVCARQNQTTPPSLHSFVCNWYRSWRKENGSNFEYFRSVKWKLQRGHLLRWVCKMASPTARRIGSFFGQVTTL